MGGLFSISTLYDLEGIKIKSYDETGDTVKLYAEPISMACPICGSLNTTKGSKYTRVLKDVPIMGKPSELIIEAHRINCHNTKASEYHNPCNNLCPSFASLGKKAEITPRLKLLIANEDFVHKTFEEIAGPYGVSAPTVASIFKEKAMALDSEEAYPGDLTALGIDEAHLGYMSSSRKARMCCTIVDLSNPKTKLLDILPNNRKETLVKTLTEKISNYSGIKIVTMDMNTGYRSAVEEVFPSAKIIVDRFHVETKLTDAVRESKSRATEFIRNELNSLPDGPEKERQINKFNRRSDSLFWFYKKLSTYNDADKVIDDYKNGAKVSKKTLDRAYATQKQFQNFTALLQDYEPYARIVSIHEAFAQIYNMPDRKSAEEAYDVFLCLLPDKNDKDNILYPFWTLAKTVNNWKEYIFNFFDADNAPHRSNGAVEMWNHEIKAIHNSGRGYDHETMRWKLLLGDRKVQFNEKRQFVPYNINKMTVFNYCTTMHSLFNEFKSGVESPSITGFLRSSLLAYIDDFGGENVYNAANIETADICDLRETVYSIGLKAFEKYILSKVNELPTRGRFIRDGVTVEEFSREAEIIKYQLKLGLENKDLLVQIETENSGA